MNWQALAEDLGYTPAEATEAVTAARSIVAGPILPPGRVPSYRQLQALDLRERGLSYEAISKEMGWSSPGASWEAVRAAQAADAELRSKVAALPEDARERALTLARMMQMAAGVRGQKRST